MTTLELRKMTFDKQIDLLVDRMQHGMGPAEYSFVRLYLAFRLQFAESDWVGVANHWSALAHAIRNNRDDTEARAALVSFLATAQRSP